MSITIPIIGFGTWVDIENGESTEIMEYTTEQALEVGYRHFDTAYDYGTEYYVVKSILNWINSSTERNRSDIFFTNKAVKIPDIDIIVNTVNSLGYYDLFLLHHPPLINEPEFSIELLEQWRKMNNLVMSGLVKSIGVSNFYQKQLEILINLCNKYNLIKPSVNQIEIHPFNQSWNLVNFCQHNNIMVVAHSPLGGLASQYILHNEIIQNIAREIGATPAQTVLANTMKRGIAVIPRSINKYRMEENLLSVNFINSITNEHLLQIKQLDIGIPMIMLANYSFEMNNRL